MLEINVETLNYHLYNIRNNCKKNIILYLTFNLDIA